MQDQQQPIKASNPLANYFRQPKMYLRLPSGGEFYPKDALDRSDIGEYAVYAMTARDELMFKTPDALMNGQATVEVIKSCIPAIKNPWVMPSIDLDACLIAIRVATYGENMEITADCPSCNHQNDFLFNLVGYLEAASGFVYENTIEIPPLMIKIRPYNYREITKASLKTLEQQKIFAIVNDDSMPDEEKIERFGESFVKLTQLTVETISGCIVSVITPEGEVSDTAMIKEFIENTSKEVFSTISDHISKMRDSIALKPQQMICQECSHQWTTEITLDQTNFFGVGSRS